MYNILKKNRLFQGLREDEIEKNLEKVEHYSGSHRKNNCLFFEGDDCKGLLIVLTGSVSCEMSDFAGKKIEIEKISSAGLIAPAFLFGKKCLYPVDVICNETTTVLTIPTGSLLRLLQLDSRILKNYLDTICSKAQFLAQRLRFLSFKTIRQKLAHYILYVSKGTHSEIILPRSQTQLSEFFGVSRPSLARVIGGLKKDGLIDYKGRQVKILNRKKLVEILKD